MNIYLFELRKKLGSTTIWILSIGFFTWVSFTMFSAFGDLSIASILEDFPDALKKAFGLQNDISSILGYFAFIGSFNILCAAIFSSNLGLTAVSVEESEMTADFLLTKPASRTTILLAKFFGAISHIVLFTVLTSAISLICIESYRAGQEYELRAFFLIAGAMLFVQLVFFTMGLFISLCLKRMESPFPFSLGIPFGLYIINSFDTIIEDTFIKYLIPFNYFDLPYIAENLGYRTYGIIACIIVITAFSTFSFVAYNKRDIATAM
jgi:ABC-2 type transport system permease protein